MVLSMVRRAGARRPFLPGPRPATAGCGGQVAAAALLAVVATGDGGLRRAGRGGGALLAEGATGGAAFLPRLRRDAPLATAAGRADARTSCKAVTVGPDDADALYNGRTST